MCDLYSHRGSQVVSTRRKKVVEGKAPSVAAEPAARPAARLSVGLLGPFDVRRQDGQSLRLPRKTQGLLAFLALQHGRPVPREQLATLLWGNSATEQARQSLRQCLAALRNTLGTDLSAPVVADAAVVLLSPSHLWTVDVAAFEAACQSKSLEDLEHASTLYRGDLLAGLQIPVELFNVWLRVERQRLASLHLDVLHRLALARAEIGDIEAAIAAAKRMAALDPLREDGHRLLMRLLASSGNRAGALKQHERCIEILRAELGIAPDAETEQLAGAIRSGAQVTGEAISLARANGPAAARAAVGPVGLHVDAQAASGPPLPDKPSIAVLPFANLSGDAAQDYFVGGLVEDITVALGKEKWLFVIASPSAFMAGHAEADARTVGAKLGVHYLLKGSVRIEAGQVLFVVQLIDAARGGHIWSGRFQDEMDNVFALQDRLATKVAAGHCSSSDVGGG